MTQIPPGLEPLPEVPAPDYTLRADGCAAEVYCRTENEDAPCVGSRCHVVSDGVTATSFRASSNGAPCFFSRTLAVSDPLWYHDAAQGGWVIPDRDLYYSVLPDGAYLTGDHPYLTYNGLYDLREYPASSGGKFPAVLETLMENKLFWMQNHGITGYKTD